MKRTRHSLEDSLRESRTHWESESQAEAIWDLTVDDSSPTGFRLTIMDAKTGKAREPDALEMAEYLMVCSPARDRGLAH